MLIISLVLLFILLIAGAVIGAVASTNPTVPYHPIAAKVRAVMPDLPVIREDEDAHLRR